MAKIYHKFIVFLIFFVLQYSFTVYSQDYYWYKGKKIELKIDTTKINVTTKIETDLDKYLQEFGSTLKVKQIETIQNRTSLFSMNLQSKKLLYSNVINNLKLQKEIISISPYFRGENDSSSIGTSSFFYIKLRKESDYKLLVDFASKINLEIVEQVPYMPLWYIVTVTNTKMNSVQASNIAYESGLFDNVDPAFMFDFSLSCTNDPYFDSLWGLKNNTYGYDINACKAWNLSTGAGIKVAVVEGGIDKTHQDLNSNILSYNTRSKNSIIRYDDHATHVAGVIAAIGNNNRHIVGVAPDASLMNVGISFDTTLSVIGAETASGISWAVANGADIINNSWGYYGIYWHSTILEDAIDNAIRNGRNGKGCVVVFCAGNYMYGYYIWYPGVCNDSTIVVGAISPPGNRARFSCFGKELDFVAPGDNIYSTVRDNKILPMSGTSFAAPHVSGIAALMLSVNPALTQKQVADIIEQTTRKIDSAIVLTQSGPASDYYDYQTTALRPNGTWSEEMGYGLVDAYGAVSVAIGGGTVYNSNDTVYYIENICRSKNNGTVRYGNLVLEPQGIDTNDFTGAKWYLNSVSTNNEIWLQRHLGTFNTTDYIANYFNNNPDSIRVNISLVWNGITYRWQIYVWDVDLTFTEFYTNLGLLNSDGKSASIVGPAKNIIPFHCNSTNINAKTSLVFDSNSFVIPPRIEGDAIFFQLKDSVCYETIKFKTNCKFCSETFTFHIYNVDLMRPTNITVTPNCAGGATITAQGGNCATLQTKWLNSSMNVIPNSENSNILNVKTSDTYFLAYYHSGNSIKPAFYDKIFVSNEDIINSKITIRNAFTDYDNSGNCLFSAVVKVDSSINNNSHRFYGSRKTEGVWSDTIPLTVVGDSINIQVTSECATEYKVTIMEYDNINQAITNTVCESTLPIDCDCKICEKLVAKSISGVTVSQDSTFGFVFVYIDGGRYDIPFQCNVNQDISLLYDSSSFYIPPYYDAVNKRICFTLKDSICCDSIKLRTNYKFCKDAIFTLYLYNFDLMQQNYPVPTFTVTQNHCEGGATIIVRDKSCANLQTKWLNSSMNVIPNSENSNILNVKTSDTYILAYYHPDDSATVLFYDKFWVDEKYIANPVKISQVINTGLNCYKGIYGCMFNFVLEINETTFKDCDFYFSKYSRNSGTWSNPVRLSQLLILPLEIISTKEFIIIIKDFCEFDVSEYKIIIDHKINGVSTGISCELVTSLEECSYNNQCELLLAGTNTAVWYPPLLLNKKAPIEKYFALPIALTPKSAASDTVKKATVGQNCLTVSNDSVKCNFVLEIKQVEGMTYTGITHSNPSAIHEIDSTTLDGYYRFMVSILAPANGIERNRYYFDIPNTDTTQSNDIITVSYIDGNGDSCEIEHEFICQCTHCCTNVELTLDTLTGEGTYKLYKSLGWGNIRTGIDIALLNNINYGLERDICTIGILGGSPSEGTFNITNMNLQAGVYHLVAIKDDTVISCITFTKH